MVPGSGLGTPLLSGVSFLGNVWDKLTGGSGAARADSGVPLTPEAVVHRQDGWQNFVTGIGTSRDKTSFGHFSEVWRLEDTQLLALFNGSDLAKKAIAKPWKEMLRRGYELTADDVDQDEIQDLEANATRLKVKTKFRHAGTFGSLFGGGVLIMGADDGQTPDKPLNEQRIKTFRFLNWVDRRYAQANTYYTDPLSPDFGQVETYRITSISNGSGIETLGGSPSTAIVHETRVIRFEGPDTDDVTRRHLQGWTYSDLQHPYDSLRKFEHAFDATNHLLSDASQAVFKLQGLINMIAAGQKDVVQARMQLIDMSRSTARAVVIDAESEDFKREATSLAGVPDLLDRQMMRIAAAFDIPVTELFGRSAAGMNSTGDNDTRKWYDLLASRQEDELAPKLKRFYKLLASAWDSPVSNKDADFEVKFRPLWQPTDQEAATYRAAVATADNIYLTQGVVTPEQVALGRWGSGKFSDWIEVDAKALQKSIDTQKAFDPYAKDPLASATGAAHAGGIDPKTGKPVPPVVDPNAPPPGPGAKPPPAPPGK